MKNFIAVIFNPDSIERMEGYLTAWEYKRNGWPTLSGVHLMALQI